MGLRDAACVEPEVALHSRGHLQAAATRSSGPIFPEPHRSQNKGFSVRWEKEYDKNFKNSSENN